MKNNEPKMAQFLDRLTHQEMQIICHQVRTHSGEQRYAHLHPGLLPFVAVQIVRDALFRGKVVRPVAAIISKLAFTLQNEEFESLMLRPRKVMRVFGPHLGSRIFNSLPGKPSVRISWDGDLGSDSARYKVHVAKKHQAAVVMWLIDNCI
jgi:hypothetical protein